MAACHDSCGTGHAPSCRLAVIAFVTWKNWRSGRRQRKRRVAHGASYISALDLRTIAGTLRYNSTLKLSRGTVSGSALRTFKSSPCRGLAVVVHIYFQIPTGLSGQHCAQHHAGMSVLTPCSSSSWLVQHHLISTGPVVLVVVRLPCSRTFPGILTYRCLHTLPGAPMLQAILALRLRILGTSRTGQMVTNIPLASRTDKIACRA